MLGNSMGENVPSLSGFARICRWNSGDWNLGGARYLASKTASTAFRTAVRSMRIWSDRKVRGLRLRLAPTNNSSQKADPPELIADSTDSDSWEADVGVNMLSWLETLDKDGVRAKLAPATLDKDGVRAKLAPATLDTDAVRDNLVLASLSTSGFNSFCDAICLSLSSMVNLIGVDSDVKTCRWEIKPTKVCASSLAAGDLGERIWAEAIALSCCSRDCCVELTGRSFSSAIDATNVCVSVIGRERERGVELIRFRKVRTNALNKSTAATNDDSWKSCRKTFIS